MSKKPKAPATLDECRAELDRLERRRLLDQQRIEFLTKSLRSYGNNKIPEKGSRWIKTQNLNHFTNRKPLVLKTEYTFLYYGHGDLHPLLVFEGVQDDGKLYYSMVNLDTFFRLFDPAPKKRARKK